MATYAELFDLRTNSELRNRIQVACIVAAETIRGEDSGTENHANRLLWAVEAFRNPKANSERMLWALLAAFKDQAVGVIANPTDAQIQEAVDAAVDLFATGA